MTVAYSAVRFRPLPLDRPADDLELEMLARWREEGLFARTLEARAGAPSWVFFEGPPTANGQPGIHHVFARTVKDLFCRHRSMTGHYVLRKAGWDTHGLPVEIEVEKQLPALLIRDSGFTEEQIRRASGKQLIEAYGVEAFNRLCRESVWRYRGDWERLSERIGYWLDYEHPYVTYTNDYVESVWWALATLHERKLLFQGHKILPYCSRCGTSLSSHEVQLGYQDVTDPSVYVAIELRSSEIGVRGSPASGSPFAAGERDGSDEPRTPSSELRSRRILVWTTTPWTLVSNVALAVHPDLAYVELRKRSGTDWTIILAQARATAVLGADYADRWETVATFRGSDLAGLGYHRPLDWLSLEGVEGAAEVIVAESFVSADDGTGVVHMAPAFGADDYAAGQRHGLAFVQPVNARGEFPAEMPVVGGQFVKHADPLIVAELERRGSLWKAGTIVHAYPHCWRCGTPLLYYARTSWFIRTTAYRDEMVERNARIDWHPEDIGARRFGDWLLNNIDWAISRDRYWGTPLPVWVCERNPEHVEVIGSYAALAARVGRPLGEDFDPHKPHVDRYEWPCEQCAAAGRSEVGGRGSRPTAGSPRESERPGAGERRAPSSALRVSAPRMRRVPEVIDTWFDSGSMPFAQWHYPFENRDMMARQYPADFIAEGVDQTRGWFYSLLAIATGLGEALPKNSDVGVRDSGFAGLGTLRRAWEPPAAGEPRAPSSELRVSEPGAPSAARFEPPASDPQPLKPAPYAAVVVNDLVLDADGVKMSKSRGNIVDPWAVVPRHGADAVRLFLVASSQVWVPRRFDEGAIREIAGGFFLTLKNVYSGMFALYANFGWAPSELDPPVSSRPGLDRWILSRLTIVEREVDRLLESFDATLAARALMAFVVDDLSNWYVRRARGRFYEVDGEDNRAAFATLHEVLVVTSRLLAPFAPFVSDWMHRELTGESVHLAPYRRAGSPFHDEDLEEAMGEVRLLSRLGRAAREAAGVKVRQPLSRLVCVVPHRIAGAVEPLLDLLAAELNVKSVTLVSSADALVTLEAKPNFRSLGKKFGTHTPLAAKAVSAFTSDELRAFERGQSLAVSVGGESRLLDGDDLVITRRAVGELTVKEEDGRFAAIDPTVSVALRREGIARELVSQVQRLRRDRGLAVSDRIRLRVIAPEEIETALREYKEWIAGELLARAVAFGEAPDDQHATHTLDLDGTAVRVAFTREA